MTRYHLNITCIDGQLGRLPLGATNEQDAETRAKAIRFLLGPNYSCTIVRIWEAL